MDDVTVANCRGDATQCCFETEGSVRSYAEPGKPLVTLDASAGSCLLAVKDENGEHELVFHEGAQMLLTEIRRQRRWMVPTFVPLKDWPGCLDGFAVDSEGNQVRLWWSCGGALSGAGVARCTLADGRCEGEDLRSVPWGRR